MRIKYHRIWIDDDNCLCLMQDLDNNEVRAINCNEIPKEEEKKIIDHED